MLLITMIGKTLESSLLRSLILQCVSVFSPQEVAQIDSSDFAKRKIKFMSFDHDS